ncbi:hypothetical protein TPA0910_36860 [Streptomyces hygroscopicus subsp. sporocinereus]|uniref:Uncharacterized protein n=1 Tax=Streptomyces hygroscopicus TaxID=1912 RepID=A0ABQ3U0W6_STRHY|nr:hypothetical protein TPA0910_36860 [Streptomyces hygroscopicus]
MGAGAAAACGVPYPWLIGPGTHGPVGSGARAERRGLRTRGHGEQGVGTRRPWARGPRPQRPRAQQSGGTGKP